jgi:RND family efflux transporter MFP subunit
MKILFHINLLSLGLLALVCFTAKTSGAIDIDAITKPSSDVMLSFMRGGNVQKVLVSEGDLVEQGQLLATLEDSIEILQLQQLQVRAEDITRVESVKIEIAQKKTDLEKLEWAKQRGAVTEWELAHARLDLETANIALTQARLERHMAQLQRDEMKARIELLGMHSPISGKIEQVLIEPGEASQPMTPVIRVVKIDPLYIDVHVPMAIAQKLSTQQVVLVKTENQTDTPYEATIKHVSAVADAASSTIRVKLELRNPELRPAGQRVIVEI